MKLRRSQLILIILFLNIELCFSQFNSDYIKIPFEIQNGYILLPFNFSKSAEFKFIFNTAGMDSWLNARGITKFSRNINQDLYEMLRKQIINENPTFTEEDVQKSMQKIYDGKTSLFRMRKMWCGDFFFYDEFFF